MIGYAHAKQARGPFEAGIATACWIVLCCRIASSLLLLLQGLRSFSDVGALTELALEASFAMALVILRVGRPLRVPVHSSLDDPRHRLTCVLVYGTLIANAPAYYIVVSLFLRGRGALSSALPSLFVDFGILLFVAFMGRWLLRSQSAQARSCSVPDRAGIDPWTPAATLSLASQAATAANNPLLDLPIYDGRSFLISGDTTNKWSIHLDSVQTLPLHNYAVPLDAVRSVIVQLSASLPRSVDLLRADQPPDAPAPVLIVRKPGLKDAVSIIELRFQSMGSHIMLSAQPQVRRRDLIGKVLWGAFLFFCAIAIVGVLAVSVLRRQGDDWGPVVLLCVPGALTFFAWDVRNTKARISEPLVSEARGLLQSILIAMQSGGVFGVAPRQAESRHEIV